MPTIINIENIENELGVKINAELNLNEKGKTNLTYRIIIPVPIQSHTYKYFNLLKFL